MAELIKCSPPQTRVRQTRLTCPLISRQRCPLGSDKAVNWRGRQGPDVGGFVFSLSLLSLSLSLFLLLSPLSLSTLSLLLRLDKGGNWWRRQGVRRRE